jgi:thiol-disulfide isomerase/thioredoxin
MSNEKKPLIFEVSQSNFEDLVVHNSLHLPVLVEFMGVWSGPCIKTADAIAKLATEFAGEFIFAKIDIDEQDELKQQFSITNVPTLVDFNGAPISKNICTISNTTRVLLGSDEIASVSNIIAAWVSPSVCFCLACVRNSSDFLNTP